MPAVLEKEAMCPDCKRRRSFTFSNTCGVYLCDTCDHHLGLARCFCGWNLQPGERLEDDDPSYDDE